MSWEIREGDALARLREMPDASVHCVVTSPPYWGLRDYGVEGQLGLEATPDAYTSALVGVFAEVRRVLRDDGTLWLVIGDSYARAPEKGGSGTPNGRNGRGEGYGVAQSAKIGSSDGAVGRAPRPGSRASPPSLKPKDLVGIPWRVAFALQAAGWWLRSDIIWAKPNPMPESVTDRPTKAHEYVFLLSKSAVYFYDADAVAERSAYPNGPNAPGSIASPYGQGFTRRATRAAGGADAATSVEDTSALRRHDPNPAGTRPQRLHALELAREKGLTPAHLAAIRSAGCTDVGKARVTQTGTGKNTAEVQRLAAEAKEALGGYYREFLSDGTRNRRTVWTIATTPYPEAHFATFPPELPDLCIRAGCPEGGTVLDPFAGAGTTGLVATRLGRNFIGVELNPTYAALARKRIDADCPLFNRTGGTA